MKKCMAIMMAGVGLILAASLARAESWGLSVGAGGVNFSYASGTPVCLATPVVRVESVVKCPPKPMHHGPRVIYRTSKTHRHAHRRVEVVRVPVTPVYVVPTYVVAPHRPVIVARCR